MQIDVYCDESCPDVFSSEHPKGNYLGIGGIWLRTDHRQEIKEKIHELRNKHKIGGEYKWTKVCPSRYNFYLDLLSLFKNEGSLKYRVILVNHRYVDLKKYHNDDAELGFYKFYYQLLTHWIENYNDYNIFCDVKQNRDPKQLKTLHSCLKNSNIYSNIQNVQAVHSNESVLIQLADLFTGAITSKYNGNLIHNSAKSKFIQDIENSLGHELRPTLKGESKFNVFLISPGSGRW